MTHALQKTSFRAQLVWGLLLDPRPDRNTQRPFMDVTLRIERERWLNAARISDLAPSLGMTLPDKLFLDGIHRTQ